MTLENAALSGLCRSPKASEANPTTSLLFEASEITTPDADFSGAAVNASESERTSIHTVLYSGENFTTTGMPTSSIGAISAPSGCHIRQDVKKKAEADLVKVSSIDKIDCPRCGLT
jgi:hypothetical protein